LQIAVADYATIKSRVSEVRPVDSHTPSKVAVHKLAAGELTGREARVAEIAVDECTVNEVCAFDFSVEEADIAEGAMRVPPVYDRTSIQSLRLKEKIGAAPRWLQYCRSSAEGSTVRPIMLF
jgi:hypothetical protein